jgi:DNA invertase Pin-like site-specific DNA recombinase
MAILGYARVSTQDQHLTGQIEALKAAGAETIYREKISGARADRPQLAKLMASLKAGDVVVVTKLDRLGRSTRELLDLIERISKAGAAFRSIGDPLWDTSSSQGRLSPRSAICLLLIFRITTRPGTARPALPPKPTATWNSGSPRERTCSIS